MNSRPQKVLVSMTMHGSIGQERLAGIFRYLSANRRWDVDIVRDAIEFTAAAMRKQIDEGLDGLIAGISSAHDTLAELYRHTTPLVILNPAAVVEQGAPDFRNRRNAVIVYNDAEAIGRAAAEEFLTQGGFKSFAYIGYPIEYGWSTIRGKAFSEVLRKNGFKTAMFDRVHFGDRIENRETLAHWLQHLQKPCGLFAVGDGPACKVIEICNELGIPVPDDIAVIGVNNDTLLCENIKPGLTSVHPDFERAGYEAARLLDALMNGRRIASTTVAIGVKEIVRRGSSRSISSGGRLVERALAFIAANARGKLNVDDVVGYLHVSRRLAELRFRELLDDSIGNVIMKQRINAVKKRLIEFPHETIERISYICGFHNPISLKNTFRRHTGLSMREWRNSVKESSANLRHISRTPRK